MFGSGVPTIKTVGSASDPNECKSVKDEKSSMEVDDDKEAEWDEGAHNEGTLYMCTLPMPQ